jgi:uncharacterized membrane protein YeiB
MLLVDEGISHGHFTFADICFLVALIVFAIAAFLAYGAKTLWATLVAAGLVAVSLGFLVT